MSYVDVLFRSFAKNATICSYNEFLSLDSTVTKITVGSNCYGSRDRIAEWDLGRFLFLKELVVGDESFDDVDLTIRGLDELESIVIGERSFRKGYGSLHLNSLPKLKELRTGCYAFSNYRVCDIGDVDALEVIEIGKVDNETASFFYASLELKSILIHSE